MATLPAILPTLPAAPALAVTDPASFVNTLVGTSNSGETFPGATTPFGMVQFSPENTGGNQTRTVEPGGYGFNATRIRGFALTHLSGTGCAGAFGDIPFFPHAGNVTGSPSADSTDATYASNFSHTGETAAAGYYRVGLGSGVNVELSATARTGAARFTYPQNQTTASLLVRTSNSEVGSSAATTTINAAARTISGSVTSGNFCGYINAIGRRSYYTLHFFAVFDQPFTSTGTWQDATLRPGTTTASGGTTYGTDGWPVAGRGSGGYVTFATGQTVNMRVGISFVSQANAQANLAAEQSGFGFDTVRQNAFSAWNTELGRIDIASGGTTAQLSTFYTALYHSLLHPNIFSDTNGQYTGMDQQVKTVAAPQRAQYANFSGWDAYRSQLQLVTLLRPDVGSDIAQSLFNQANHNGGVWDRWTHAQGGTHVMTGDPAHAALPSIYAFGGTGFNASGALSSMVSAATTVTAADLSRDGWNVMVVGERPSLDKWLSLNYIPTNGNAWGGAGETLEVSIADFALSQLAQRLGQASVQSQFLARGQYWKNVFNPGNGGFIQNRNDNGTWPSFSASSSSGFAEGSAAQYTWMVPHNVKGLFDRMGGNTTASNRLDTFFHNSDGSWALTGAGGLKAEMDNEPSIGSPWLYNFAGRPYKTQETVRQVLNTLWSNTPGGIPGQDDLGAMSSWYVWSAMGVYPLTPGRAELLLTSPLFPQIVVRRSNGVTINITTTGSGPYIQSASTTRSWLPESFVSSGGMVSFTLGSTPNTSWGAALADAPPSFDTGGSGPSNVALNKPAVGSAACNANEGPAKAVNGSVSGGTSDKFCTLATTKFLQVDLGQSFALTSVTVRHAGAGGESTSWNTRDYDIQVSSDGTTWTTLVQARGNTASVSTHAISATARYARLNILAPQQSGTGAARIYEFEVYA